MTRLVIIDLFLLVLMALFLRVNKVESQFLAKDRKGTYVLWSKGTYQMFRNGAPYTIRGAAIGPRMHVRDVAQSGGNSVRIYSTENAQAVLDSAAALGLTVMVGLYLPKAEMEADWNDDVFVDTTLAYITREVEKYKDHPALLCWGLGNEVDLFVPYRISTITRLMKIWKIMDKLAGKIRELDPGHPVATSISSGNFRFTLLHLYTKNIDLVALNSFATENRSLTTRLLSRLGFAGLTGPHIYSELGGMGYWQSPALEWNSRKEQTSIHKLAYLKNLYREVGASPKCLGSFVFYWDYKFEFTPTWFSMYTDSGERLEILRGLADIWNEKTSPQRYGSILETTLLIPEGRTLLATGEKFRFRFQLDTAGLVSHGYIEVRREADYLYADQALRELPLLARYRVRLEKKHATHYAQLVAPVVPGAYRVYLYLCQPSGYISTANEGIYVYENPGQEDQGGHP